MSETIAAQLIRMDLDRMRNYKEFLDFYRGQQWDIRERRGERHLTFNYARVFIDKITSYLMSGVNFAVDPGEDSDEACVRAQKAESALYQVYQENNLEQLDLETETDCAVLGDACYKVIWDGTAKKVKVTSPDVQGIYAWWWGDDPSRVWRVAAKYSLSLEEAELLYDTKPKGKTATIVELWTDHDFELYLDGTLLEKKPNPYGFIPFVVFPNLREPKQFWGSSDLPQITELQRELNRALSQLSRILELSGNPIAVLENIEESEDIAIRPGAVWNIPEDAKAYLLDLLQIEDRNLGTVAEASQRGDAFLREAEIKSAHGSILVPVNCGQQLYDVVDITDSRAGLDEVKKRVLGVMLWYQPRLAEYRQRLWLGVV
ncbi:phage portal protein [Chloroflexota bacterium]